MTQKLKSKLIGLFLILLTIGVVAGTLSGPNTVTTNGIPRYANTKGLNNSQITIDDSDNIDGVNIITVNVSLDATNGTIYGRVDLGVSLATDDTCRGFVRIGLNNSGGVNQWEPVYLNSSSQWVVADANGSSTYPVRGIATATVSTGGATTVITQGAIRNDSWTWTPGGTIYLSVSVGTLTQTAPSTSGDKVQVLGYALDADTMAVEISQDYVTVP